MLNSRNVDHSYLEVCTKFNTPIAIGSDWMRARKHRPLGSDTSRNARAMARGNAEQLAASGDTNQLKFVTPMQGSPDVIKNGRAPHPEV
jgi:hypothetical protein